MTDAISHGKPTYTFTVRSGGGTHQITFMQPAILFRGELFHVASIPVTRELFKNLGLRDIVFRFGANIYTLGGENYQRFSRLCGAEDAGGFYPLSVNGDQDAVISGQLEYLPTQSRTIVLPEGYSEITLIHELLHDVFNGGGIAKKDRDYFINELFVLYSASCDSRYQWLHNNQDFFQSIAGQCMERYKLEDISPYRPPRDDAGKRAFHIFADECFAYAGEALLRPNESKFKNVPYGIQSLLSNLRIRALTA